MSAELGKYKPYPKYKNSNIEWLGLIPIHWRRASLKYLSKNLVTGLTPPTVDENNYSDDEYDYPWIRPEDLNDSISPSIATRWVTKKGWGYLRPVMGDSALICCIGTIGKLGFTDRIVSTNQQITSVSFYNSARFYFYQLIAARKELEESATGNVIKILNSERLGNIQFAKATDIEAKQISNFLDYETARIDRLIAKQQQLIELLKEKRQAVISHVVTKGLNPDVQMKDSGVEWLGQVPEHWLVKQYRYATKLFRGKFGHRPRNDPSLYDGSYPFIQTGDIARTGKFITSYNQTLNEKGRLVSQKFPSGTLVMAIAANIGDTAILEFDAYCPDSVVGFKPNNNVDIEFLRLSFSAALPALEQTSTQSTQANLNLDRIGSVYAAFPPINEQLQINAHVGHIESTYAKLEAKAKLGVQLLQERRTAIISAAVTGKIDLRSWEDPTGIS